MPYSDARNRARLAVLAGAVLTAGALIAGSLAVPSSADEPYPSDYPTVKAQQEQAAQQQMANYRAANTGPKQPTPKDPPPETTPLPPRSGGIAASRQAPFSPSVFPVENMWSGEVDGQWLVVFAGGKVADDQTHSVPLGGVRIMVAPLDPNSNTPPSAIEELDLSSTHLGQGPLTALSVQGTTMSLQTRDGHTVTFELQNRQFSS